MPVSADLAQIFEPIRGDLEAVEQEFVRHIQSRVALIPEMGRYIQSSGGKRVRPAVLLMASRLCGYTGDRAVLYASVVEFIHTATLVHDDIIDGADLRRGRLAVHSRWGNDITVLLGDYLYIKSMAMALTQDSLEIIRVLCDVTLRMIEGELYQLTKTGDADITEEEHFEIIRRKTAFLFGGCAQIGGMLGDVSARRRAEGIRLQPWHRLPAGRRPARLHRGCNRAGEADWRRPAGREGHPPNHLPAAPGR
jgi:octaprenyl-diphosphate synthase